MPNVASCHAMANLLKEKQNTFWHAYEVVVAAGVSAGIGLSAVPPVRKAIGNGFDTKTITLSCGKLTTGITVKQWSSILMLRNLKSPETYFQAAFRIVPWSIKNPNGDDPNEEEIIKPVCFVFDFAPELEALRQLSDYGIGLSPNEANPENAVRELVSFLPVLAYDGANMTQIDAGGILDIAMAGTSATLLARKWKARCWSMSITTPCAGLWIIRRLLLRLNVLRAGAHLVTTSSRRSSIRVTRSKSSRRRARRRSIRSREEGTN